MRDRRSDTHRRVATKTLGRPVRPGHDVDHLNENKDDNSPANLREMPHGAHSRATQSPGRKSLRRLQKSLGMIRRKEKMY